MNLPSRARNGLNGVARELLRQPMVEKPRRQWVDDVVAWCHQHDIDLASRINSKALLFDAALLAQIDDVLESARIAPLGRSLSGLTSSAQAKEGVEEDKNNPRKPPRTAGTRKLSAAANNRAYQRTTRYSRCGCAGVKAERV